MTYSAGHSELLYAVVTAVIVRCTASKHIRCQYIVKMRGIDWVREGVRDMHISRLSVLLLHADWHHDLASSLTAFCLCDSLEVSCRSNSGDSSSNRTSGCSCHSPRGCSCDGPSGCACDGPSSCAGDGPSCCSSCFSRSRACKSVIWMRTSRASQETYSLRCGTRWEGHQSNYKKPENSQDIGNSGISIWFQVDFLNDFRVSFLRHVACLKRCFQDESRFCIWCWICSVTMPGFCKLLWLVELKWFSDCKFCRSGLPILPPGRIDASPRLLNFPDAALWLTGCIHKPYPLTYHWDLLAQIQFDDLLKWIAGTTYQQLIIN